MKTKIKKLTIDRNELNQNNYVDISSEIINKEHEIPIQSVLLKIINQILIKSEMGQ